MIGALKVYIKLTKIDTTSGYYRGMDQRGILIESMGRLMAPQIDGFIRNENKFKDDEIFTATVNLECTKSSPIFDIPEELVGKAIGTCRISRGKVSSLRGRKTEAFQVQMNLKIDEHAVATILALKSDWISIEPIFYEQTTGMKLSELGLDEKRELFVERIHIGANYEL